MADDPSTPKPETAKDETADDETVSTAATSEAMSVGSVGSVTSPAGAPSGSSLPPVVTAAPDTGYTSDGVPTFDGVREKIETRYGTALGSTELAEETREGRTAAQQYEARHQAAADKLEQIRASMHKNDGAD